MKHSQGYIACATLFFACVIFGHQAVAQSESKQVDVETVVVSPAEPSADEKAAALWQKTKKETGEAASTAAEFTKVQSKKALDKTKEGVSKGADAVAEGSKKAWSATKEVSKKAATATVTAVEKTGDAIKDAVQGDDQNAPVTERSVE